MSESSDHDGRCADCRAEPPITDTEYTLISSQHGWRCTKVVNEQGHPMIVWRCPKCWARHRGRDPSATRRSEGCAANTKRGWPGVAARLG